VASSPASEVVTFAEFQADLRARELRWLGAKVKLPDQSFQVLAMLLERPGKLVTREELHTQLWPADTFIDFDHGLNNAVNRLREALGDSADNPRFVETLPRRGYRFIGTTNGAIYAPGVSDAQSVPAEVLTQKEKGSKRWMMWTLLPLLILSLAAIIGLWPTSAPSSRSFVLPPEGTTFDLIGDGGGAIALSPDGAKIAFVADDSRGNAQIWVRPLSKLSADPIPGTLGATFPFWSADEKRVSRASWNEP
jgi:DNA-binding winged helix-turn-helix (wHTH) protein